MYPGCPESVQGKTQMTWGDCFRGLTTGPLVDVVGTAHGRLDRSLDHPFGRPGKSRR